MLTADGVTAPRGTATARARIVEDDQTVAIAASNPNRLLMFSCPMGRGRHWWSPSEPIGIPGLCGRSELTAPPRNPSGFKPLTARIRCNLTMEYTPTAGKWLWLIPGIVGIVTVLLAIQRQRVVDPGGRMTNSTTHQPTPVEPPNLHPILGQPTGRVVAKPPCADSNAPAIKRTAACWSGHRSGSCGNHHGRQSVVPGPPAMDTEARAAELPAR